MDTFKSVAKVLCAGLVFSGKGKSRHGSILGGSLKRSPPLADSKSGVTIPKSFGFEAATHYGATNQSAAADPESELFEPCRNLDLEFV